VPASTTKSNNQTQIERRDLRRDNHVHDEQMKGAVKFQYVTSESNPADLLTKPLAVPRHERLLQLTGLTLEPDDEKPKYDQ